MKTTWPFRLWLPDGEITDWRPSGDAFDNAANGLRVQVRRTPVGPAEEFTTAVENLRDAPSPLITRVCFFRARWPIAADEAPVIHHAGGGVTDAVFPSRAWRAQRSELLDWATLRLEGAQGRSSNRDLPIFSVTDAADTRGIVFVAGYSGHVVNTITREADYRSVAVESGIHDLQLRLPPRGRVRLGSMLTLPYEGDADTGRNLLRRTLREYVCPPAPAGRVRPEVTYAHWFGIERNFTAESLLREAEIQAELGAEVFELDAAWARPGARPHYGAGNWAHEDREKFPDGIRAFADRVRALGMRFGIWLEPETVEEGTALHAEHPEWLIARPGAHRHLFDFGNPEAAAYMTALIADVIERYGAEWTRMDSNLNPSEYWATIADPGERGWRELRHWEGWYRFLDELRRRFPGLHIEGCSSGGRRIDLEMLKRSHSFWISDNTAFPATVHQHIGGANRWLPSHLLNAEAVKYPLFPQKVRPYDQVGDETFSDFWLATLMGGLFGLGGPHSAYPAGVNEKFKRFIARYKEIRHLLDADFYPLLPQPRTSADWDAWQFHDTQSGCGMVLVFRQRGGPTAMMIRPRGFDAGAAYRLRRFPAGHRSVTLAKANRRGWRVTLSHPYTTVMIQYTVRSVQATGVR